MVELVELSLNMDFWQAVRSAALARASVRTRTGSSTEWRFEVTLTERAITEIQG